MSEINQAVLCSTYPDAAQAIREHGVRAAYLLWTYNAVQDGSSAVFVMKDEESWKQLCLQVPAFSEGKPAAGVDAYPAWTVCVPWNQRKNAHLWVQTTLMAASVFPEDFERLKAEDAWEPADTETDLHNEARWDMSQGDDSAFPPETHLAHPSELVPMMHDSASRMLSAHAMATPGPIAGKAKMSPEDADKISALLNMHG